ncbi:MAG TPA: fibrillarin-like rRNA/tRNA 2'-O-methyltransferase [Candidatus Nanoarchaeia archaeon]|nr:fibrillarin-like rRNA/tRNA 2'-O-methyltransferase [Candidatus Nanoarchaeia archaeon]
MKQSRIFEVYETDGNRISLFTRNLVPGKSVYGEKLVRSGGVEYRQWDVRKSKLAATIFKGSTNVGIRKDDVVLYLGAASGTTVSHVSDMVGAGGFVFALDFAPRVVRDLVFLAEERPNIAPLLADANKPLTYIHRVCKADVVYQDIAQKNQLEIFLKNVQLYLKKDGYCLLAVKARSIDVAQKPKALFSEIKQKLEKELTLIDYRILDPFELDHAMFICKKTL